MEWSQNGDSNKWSLNDPLKTLDPEMYNLIREEKDRQRKGSSSSFCTPARSHKISGLKSQVLKPTFLS